MSDELCLRVHDVSSGYGRLKVLWGIDLDVPVGSAVVLLGPNGAGKTTLLRTIIGLLPVWDGEVRFFGQPINRLGPDKRVAASIAYASETGVFGPLSVADNLRVGAYGLPRRQARAALARTWEEFPMLAQRRHSHAASLSGGQRKQLALAKALMRRPRLLVMDEPSSGLSPKLVDAMVSTLTSVRQTHNVTLLLAEQNAKFLDLADRVCIINGGRTGFHGPLAEFRAHTDIAAQFFGLPDDTSEESGPPEAGEAETAP
ncbi:MAG TPA: ABC transporter ATP-binding protein [Streptosporangiaceae bacterium]|nr:ABC transporter ATP-binding protein [Streptosporangiaceae bacterium]